MKYFIVFLLVILQITYVISFFLCTPTQVSIDECIQLSKGDSSTSCEWLSSNCVTSNLQGIRYMITCNCTTTYCVQCYDALSYVSSCCGPITNQFCS